MFPEKARAYSGSHDPIIAQFGMIGLQGPDSGLCTLIVSSCNLHKVRVEIMQFLLDFNDLALRRILVQKGQWICIREFIA